VVGKIRVWDVKVGYREAEKERGGGNRPPRINWGKKKRGINEKRISYTIRGVKESHPEASGSIPYAWMETSQTQNSNAGEGKLSHNFKHTTEKRSLFL